MLSATPGLECRCNKQSIKRGVHMAEDSPAQVPVHGSSSSLPKCTHPRHQGSRLRATASGSLPHQPNPRLLHCIGPWNTERTSAKQPPRRKRACALGVGFSLPGPHCLFFCFSLFVLGTGSGWPGGPADQWRMEQRRTPRDSPSWQAVHAHSTSVNLLVFHQLKLCW